MMTNVKKSFVIAIAVIGLAGLGAFAYYANRPASAPAGAPPGAGGAPGGVAGMARMAGMEGMSGTGGKPDAKPGAGAGGGGAAGAGAPGGFAIGVEAIKVERTVITDDVTAVGTLGANESVVLRPEIAGRIESINFKEGAAVAKGTLLVALDASTQAADLQQAKANLALARSNYNRTEDLFRKKFVSASAQDQAASNLKVQEAATAQAQARFNKTRLLAPFAGVIGIRNVSVGDYVKEGQELVNLEDISSLKVDFKLPERYLNRVQKGQSVELASDAKPGESFTATVDAIDPLIDTNGRAIALRARLPNPDGKLRPGMFVRARLIFGQRNDVLIVPEEAMVPSGSDQFVFRVVDGKAQRVKIKTGVRRNAKVEVVEGLGPEDLVVTAGQLKIRDGLPVRVVEPGAGKG
jgi:membrane fusion protein (multidrug efflux system)